MSKKDNFINLFEKLLESTNVSLSEEDNDGLAYFDVFKKKEVDEKVKFTENGKLILDFLQKNYTGPTFPTMFKSKEISTMMLSFDSKKALGPKTVSGSMRKLVTDGYLEKIGENPAIYTLTELGKTVSLED